MEFRKKYIRYLKQNKNQPNSQTLPPPPKKPQLNSSLRHLHRAHHSCTATHKHRHNPIIYSPQQPGRAPSKHRGWQIKNFNKTKRQKKKKASSVLPPLADPARAAAVGQEQSWPSRERGREHSSAHVGGVSAPE